MYRFHPAQGACCGYSGRHNDQVDAISQALKFVTLPSGTEEFIELMKWQALRGWGIELEDLTVAFDHPDPDIRFTLPSGRSIGRERDSYFWVTEKEWESATYLRREADQLKQRCCGQEPRHNVCLRVPFQAVIAAHARLLLLP